MTHDEHHREQVQPVLCLDPRHNTPCAGPSCVACQEECDSRYWAATLVNSPSYFKEGKVALLTVPMTLGEFRKLTRHLPDDFCLCRDGDTQGVNVGYVVYNILISQVGRCVIVLKE